MAYLFWCVRLTHGFPLINHLKGKIYKTCNYYNQNFELQLNRTHLTWTIFNKYTEFPPSYNSTIVRNNHREIKNRLNRSIQRVLKDLREAAYSAWTSAALFWPSLELDRGVQRRDLLCPGRRRLNGSEDWGRYTRLTTGGATRWLGGGNLCQRPDPHTRPNCINRRNYLNPNLIDEDQIKK